jgi:hypothetical protein
MKNKLLAVMAIFGMVASASAVKINNNLSINGFIDGSYSLTDNSGSTADEQSLGLDEVEINFNLNVGNVSGLIAVDTDGAEDENNNDNSDSLFNIEQAHFTYNVNDSLSVTFGKYGSALGFEGEDPAGLYTYSRAYSDSNGSFNLANVDAAAVNGVTVAYSADTFSIAASFEEAEGTDLETNDLNMELAVSYTGFAGVTIGGGYFFDNSDDNETDILNIHVSRQVGKLLLAAEYTETSSSYNDGTADLDLDGYLLLADYDVNEKLGVAVRLSNHEQAHGTTKGADYEKFTIAPNYAITESLGAILEYSDVDDAGTDSEVYAIELTYTF